MLKKRQEVDRNGQAGKGRGQVWKEETGRERNRQEGTEKRERNTMKGSDREREGCGYLYIIIHTENSYMYLS